MKQIHLSITLDKVGLLAYKIGKEWNVVVLDIYTSENTHYIASEKEVTSLFTLHALGENDSNYITHYMDAKDIIDHFSALGLNIDPAKHNQ